MTAAARSERAKKGQREGHGGAAEERSGTTESAKKPVD